MTLLDQSLQRLTVKNPKLYSSHDQLAPLHVSLGRTGCLYNHTCAVAPCRRSQYRKVTKF